MSNDQWAAPGRDGEDRAGGSTPLPPPPPYDPTGEAPAPPAYQPGYAAPSGHPQQPGHEQPQGHGHGQQPGYGQPPAYGPPPAYGQGPAYGQAPPPGGYPSMAMVTNPGIVPLRPLFLGDILGAGFKILRFNPRATIGLSLALQLIGLLLVLPFVGWLLTGGVQRLGDLSDPDNGSSPLLNLVQVPSSLFASAATLVLCVVVSRAVIGERATIGEAWRELRPQIGRLLLFLLVTGLLWLAGLGLVALALYGLAQLDGALAVLGGLVLAPVFVFVYVRLGLATSALILERIGVIESLRRSWTLSRGAFWRLFGIQLVTSLVVGFAAGALMFPVTMVGMLAVFATSSDSPDSLASGFLVMMVIVGLAQVLIAAVTTPITSTVSTLLYIDQRIRREGLDVELARAVERRATQER
ncbi:hypothetical protein [Arsenicicoccus bolidensis]|uniref:hypothetical protein n=1 Tax=Arsenicicoccus bolidensis TaxID=229480 RepID=UPI0004117CC2|nr:hypothetical protein [Arsenicicoccus bolidensis]